ncbi:MAG: TetR/AcrR family transcriptional regulator [Actinomycetota bacterium]
MRGNKREAILDAAVKVFAKRGFYNTRVKDIATEIDVAEGTLYKYFPTKNDILFSLFKEKWSELTSDLRRKIEPLDDANEKMMLILTTIVDVFKTNRDLAELFLIEIKQSSAFLNSPVVESMVDFLDLLEEILKEGIAKGVYRKDLDTKAARMMIFGAAQGVLLGWILKETIPNRGKAFDYTIENAIKTIRDVFKSGITSEKK